MNPVEVSQLKKYYGDIKAVDGISFTVNQGEVFGLLGPNGAGRPPLSRFWKAYGKENVET
jgi:ABC-2 type transport system ATP-binding protein